MKKKIIQIVLILSVVSFIMTLFTIAQEYILDDIRSYVRGESLYSRGQSDAARSLLRYMNTHEEEDFNKFLEEFSVPLGDKLAREALLKSKPDYDAAYKGFLQGKNHPDDIDGMIFFLINFQGAPYVKDSIHHWMNADAVNDQILKLAYTVKKDIQNKLTHNLVSYEKELNTLIDKGEQNQNAFSSTLSDGARWLQKILFYVTIGIFLILMLVAFFLIRRIFNDLEKDELALEASRNRTEEASNTAKMGFWSLEFSSMNFEIDETWFKMLGTSSKDQGGHIIPLEILLEKFMPESSQLIVEENIDEIFQRNSSYKSKVTYQLVHSDGDIKDVYAEYQAQYKDGKPFKIVGVTRDITEEKALHERIQHQKEEFEAIFSSSIDGIALIDLESNFLKVNDAYVKMTGYTNDELLKLSCIKLSTLDDLQRSKKSLEIVLETGSLQNFEKSCVKKDGSILRVNLSAALMPDKNTILLTAKDITLIKKQEEAFLAQQKMAQMGEMISMIAHQWRQPLSTISATAMNIKVDLELDESQTKQEIDLSKQDYIKELDFIQQMVQNLSTTIDDFRTFFKPNKEMQEVLLQTPVDKALEVIKSSIEAKGVSLTLRYKSEKRFYIFENEVMQVVLNILKNAQDNFIEKQTSKPLISIDCIDTQDGAEISICDNGGGIPEDVFAKIFDPYFSTKNDKNGTGLGLYMSKIMIEKHHRGTLSVQNNKDGCCFKIALKKSDSSTF